MSNTGPLPGSTQYWQSQAERAQARERDALATVETLRAQRDEWKCDAEAARGQLAHQQALKDEIRDVREELARRDAARDEKIEQWKTLTAERDQLRAESEGRRAQLFDCAEERTREWKRAENAKADIARRDLDWTLAFGDAVGMSSGLNAPLMPSALKECMAPLLTERDQLAARVGQLEGPLRNLVIAMDTRPGRELMHRESAIQAYWKTARAALPAPAVDAAPPMRMIPVLPVDPEADALVDKFIAERRKGEKTRPLEQRDAPAVDAGGGAREAAVKLREALLNIRTFVRCDKYAARENIAAMINAVVDEFAWLATPAPTGSDGAGKDGGE